MSNPNNDFSNFRLAEDNVYELAGGLIPDIADKLQVDLGNEPNVDALGTLVGKIGANKVLRDNGEVSALDREEMVEMLGRTGVQKSLERSLWTPDITPGTQGVTVAVMTGGVANWMDRSERALPVWMRGMVHLPTGKRVMDTGTEVSNKRVRQFHEMTGRCPTEAEYAARVIMPRIARRKGSTPILDPYATIDGDEIARFFFEENPSLLTQKLLFVRVANAGVQLAVQMRKAARQFDAGFDSDPENPQVFIATDHFPIAHNGREERNPVRFQKAQTGLRQAVLTAKLILEAQQQDARS